MLHMYVFYLEELHGVIYCLMSEHGNLHFLSSVKEGLMVGAHTGCVTDTRSL